MNSRQIGYAIRDAVRADGVECSSFFHEEPVESEAAQEALTLITLLAQPSDRVALRAWLSFRSSTQRTPAYRRLLAAARESDTDVEDILVRLDRGENSIPYTSNAVERYRELQLRLVELQACGDDLASLVDELLPETNSDLSLLREAALKALEDADSVSLLANALRYGVAQRETPLESTEVRVMSLHASKGLTADLVVLAGLVEGLIPRIDLNVSPAEQEAQEQEQRRLFFVGITRTTDVLVLSSYAELDVATAHRLQVRRGPRTPGGFRTFASSFFDELGDGLPTGVRGEEWRYV